MKANQENQTAPRGRTLTEEAFSRQIGSLQRRQSLYTLITIPAVIGCFIAAVFFQKLILAAVLFAAAAAAILLACRAQKQKRAQLRSHFGKEFSAELARVFGPEPQTPELPIDERYLRASQLTGRPWERCEIRDFHEGVHRGLRFSAANVLLEHVYETHHPHDGTSTNTAKMLGGIVIRCRTALPASVRVAVCERIEPEEQGTIRTASADFDRRFITESASQGAALTLLTPLFLGALTELEKHFRGELGGLIWEADTLTLAFNTGYVFAGVPDTLDAREPDAVRNWYRASLKGMCFVLDMLIKSSPLLAASD